MQGTLFAEAGNILQDNPSGFIGIGKTPGEFVAHGFVGGIVSLAGGGKFGSGFLAGGISSLGPSPNGMDEPEQAALGAVEHAILGGLGSVLGGGKFQNGAITGAFAYAASSLAGEGGHAATSNTGSGGSSRPLTPGEIALAQANEPNSGDSVDWSQVTLSPCNCDRSFTFGHTVYLDDKLIGIPDFSDPSVSTFDVSTLVHEFVHVWQYENWGPITYLATAAVTHTYSFALYPNTSFESLNMEQQAMVFQDYYLMTHGYNPILTTNSPSLQTFQGVISQVQH